MSSNTKAHVSIVLDGVEAQRVLNALKNQASQVREEMAKMEQAGQIDTKEYKELSRTLKALEGDYRKNSKQLSDLDVVMKNLSTQTSRQLTAALKTIATLQRDIDTSTEEGKKKMEELREQYAAISEQARHLSLSYIDIDKAMANLNTTSSATLSKAISQLKDERAQLDPTKKEYRTMTQIIAAMNSELSRRDGAMTGAKASETFRNAATASANDIKQAIEYYEKFKASLDSTNTKGIQEIDNRLSVLRQQQMQNIMSADRFNAIMGDLDTASVDDMKDALKVLEMRINSATRGTQEYMDLCEQYKEVKDALGDVNNDLKDQESLWETIKNKVGGYATAIGTAFAGGALFKNVFDNTLEYSDALADIQKTTGITGDSLNTLAENLKKIDTRTAVSEINALAYSAGKLGVQGVKDVEAFVRSANMLTVALGDELGGSEATESLMKIAMLMGSVDSDGLEGALIRTGSAINEVTQASTAAAGPVVDFMSRIASVGKITGMSTSDLVGLGSAINSLGQNTEAAASSVQKMLISIATNTEGVAKALKMSASETKQFFVDVANDNMTAAFLKVLEKANQTDGLEGLKSIIGDIGGDGVRTIQTLSTLATSHEHVAKLIQISNQAYEDGTSVIDEYNIKNENAAALWERLKNNFNKLTIRPEFVKALEDLLRRIQSLPDAVGRFVDSLSFLGKAFVTVLEALTHLMPLVTGFLYALTVRTVIVFGQQLIVLVKSLGTAAVAFFRAATGANSFGAALKLVGKAAALNALTAVVAVLVSVYEAFAQAGREAKQFAEQIGESFMEVKRQSEQTKSAIEKSIKSLYEANEATGERSNVIKQLNEQYSDYLGYLLDEKMDNDQIAASLRAVNQQLRIKALLQAKASGEEQIRSSFSGQRSQTLENLTEVTSQWLQKRGMDVNAASSRAAELAETMIEQASSLLREVKDANGNIIGYNRATTNRRDDREANAQFQQTMRTIFGKDSAAANFGFQFIQEALAEYMNQDAQMNSRIRQNENLYKRDIRLAASDEQQTVEPLVKEAWEKVVDVVTQNGTITERINEEQAAQYLQYAQGLEKDVRAENLTNVTVFVTRATRLLEDMVHQGTDKDANGNLTPEFQQLQTRLQNAISMQSSLNKASATGGGGGGGTDPDAKELQARLQAQRDHYKASIEAVDAYYQMQRQVVNDAYEQEQIDDVEREARLRELEQRNLQSRAQARRRAIGQITAEQWQQEEQLMLNLNQAGEKGTAQMKRIMEIDFKAIGDLLHSLGKDAEFETIIKQIQDDVIKAQDLRIKRIQELEKMVINRSALGKLTAEYETTMRQLDLISSRFMAEGETDLKAYFQRMMQIAREVGKQAGTVDLNTDDGISKARETMIDAGMTEEQVNGMSPAEIRAYFYNAYKYAEEYSSMSQKLAKKTLEDWEKTYQTEGGGADYDRRIEKYQQMAQIAERMEQYGLSEAVALEKQLDIATLLYLKERDRLDAKMQHAKDNRQAAANIEDENTRNAEITKADEEIAMVKREYDKLIPLYQGMMDAAIALDEYNHRWIVSMKDAFVELGDSFVSFRSFYEDNGSMVSNIFGTVEERQSAFADFVDSMKKATRTAIMEKVKQSLSMKLQDQIDLAWRKMFLGRQAAEEQIADARRLAGKAVTHTAEQGMQAASNAVIEGQNQAHNQKMEADDAQHTVKDVALSEASGVAKAFAQLGPVAGAVAVALITAVIGSFLTMALNAVGHQNHGQQGAATKTKSVSGMLTYDQGNAPTVLAAPVPNGSPLGVTADNGRHYAAVTDYQASGLLTRPTVTTVGGSPALVAEEGPELVVGRQTTRTLLMDYPGIVRTILNIERHHRRAQAHRAYALHAFDDGNAADLLTPGTAPVPGASASGQSGITEETAAALTTAIATLTERLQHPITAQLNANGRGGATDQIAKSMYESLRHGDLDSVKRLFKPK